MSRIDIKSQNRSILWAYKKNLLGFTSHRKKRENKIKKEVKRGIREANTEDPFELFVSLHNIRYVYYKETEKILGNTFGMCILQDFEAITPNLLARTIETVEGGGLVVLLLKGMNSLKQLYTLSMDVHSRYRTEAHNDVTARFNERFILSLGKCESCLVIDDEMNVLPISGGKNVRALPPPDLDAPKSNSQIELERMKEELQDTQPTGALVNLAKTVDQAKALKQFVAVIAGKTLRSTVTLTAARGRGKSAALGVAVAAAVAYGYGNIFVTSPSPENLKTFWDFIFKGFDALGYMDHIDYTIIQSTNPDFNKAIVRINIHREHRQTIQYIRPQDAHVLGQAELLVIDEAAAIPLPLVRKLIGPYLVFMASTINGYEGTGRSLSLKLIKQLKEESRGINKANEIGRSLTEIKLEEPIRYTKGDSVEKWLNTLLCLEADLPRSKLNTMQGCPDPSQCQLVKVNRDTLFSFHPVSEKFLQQMIALYVSSHYKNSPDDLQLMSDAPAHQLFVLVPPIEENSKELPEPLCVIQVALEGQISKESVLSSLSRGRRAAGDLIPWVVSEQFQEQSFAGLSGARIVRIATNPDYIQMGYGSKAMELLTDFYEGKFADLSENSNGYVEEIITRVTDAELSKASLLADDVQVRDIRKMPPLFTKLAETRPDRLDYIGVSYGLTQPLHRFWKRASFTPVYLRQTPNELTGEHTCVMLRPLESNEDSGIGAFAKDFHTRFLELLSDEFRVFPSILALSIDESSKLGAKLDTSDPPRPLTRQDLDALLTPYDLKRLEAYANSLLDYRVIRDLVRRLAMTYFTGRLSAVKLTGIQSSILLALGLQHKDLSAIETELSLPSSQLLAMLTKIMRKLSSHFSALVSGAIEASLPARDTIGVSREDASGAHDDEIVDEKFAPLESALAEELEEGGDEAMAGLREKQRQMIDALPLDRYEIEDGTLGWKDAEKQVLSAMKGEQNNVVVSVKSTKKRKAGETAAEIYEQELGEKKENKKAKKEKKGKKERS
ncbi:GNAT acetyltransferase 2-domain-containing protein [Calycina marina]|uniref:RNA cytidine acetyltransferase n=1 Tax=Calycina marina TaxID=1763456 RepID=A0A9P8CGD8_9HELO|nr:GNAT acetyltransferase 2-domain-containing protein [Calycina marina]